jgi:hypothetical protein
LTAPLKRIAKEAKKKKIKTPALAVIGEVVELREKIEWFENKPLFGLRILVTGSKQQAFELAKNLEELGAITIMLPTVRVTHPDSWEDLDSALDRLHNHSPFNEGLKNSQDTPTALPHPEASLTLPSSITTFPLTMVSTGHPFSSHPSYGV